MSKRNAPKIDIGRLGEETFSTWCTGNGIDSVRAVSDRWGWDHLVEFEEIDEALPLDQRDDLKKILIQVKSTSKSSPSTRGTLSAFKRLVDVDLPAFIVHNQYSSQKLQRSLLLHIGPVQIETILRKVRQKEHKGRVDLNNFFIQLPLVDALDIALDGSNLREFLVKYVPQRLAEYSSAKSSLRKRCDFDSRSIVANFALAHNMQDESVVDLLIGVVPQLPLQEMIVTKSRFGSSLEKDIDHFGPGFLSVDIKPLQRAKIVAFSPELNSRATLEVDVFAPGITNLPSDLQKVRLANDLIEVIILTATGRAHMKFNIDPSKAYSLDVLANALKFGLLLAENDGQLEIDFGGGAKTTGLNIPAEAKQFRYWKVIHEFIDRISVAIFRFSRGDKIQTTLREMQEALEKNANMFAILAREGVEFKFSGGVHPPLPDQAVLFAPVCITFGSIAYSAIIKIHSKQLTQEDDGSIRFEGGEPVAVQENIIDRASLDLVKLNERTKELARRTGKKWAIATSLAVSPTAD